MGAAQPSRARDRRPRAVWSDSEKSRFGQLAVRVAVEPYASLCIARQVLI
jgi:hypothetical protein